MSKLALILVLMSLVCKADDLRQADVTVIIQDVRVLPTNQPPRPATLGDIIKGTMAVKTGFSSRTELTFQDATVTRIGSRSIFTFKDGTRIIALKSGSVLLYVPRGAPPVKVKMEKLTATAP